MDLNRILYFVTVAECGSFTKAGKKLKLPKSTLSRHIKNLEDDLQVRLLNRSTRKLSTTRAGERFFNECLPLVTHLQNAQNQVSDLHHDLVGCLKITMPTELGGFLKQTLPEFMQLHPEIDFEIDFSTTNHDLIKEGYDLAIRIGEMEDSSYIARRLMTPQLAFYASPSFLLKHGQPQTIDDLNAFPNILISLRKRWVMANSQKVIERTNGRISTNSMNFNREMCLKGLGIALLPGAYCEEDVKAGRLVNILKDEPIQNPNVYAVYPSRNHLSKALKTFIDFIAQEMADHYVKRLNYDALNSRPIRKTGDIT